MCGIETNEGGELWRAASFGSRTSRLFSLGAALIWNRTQETDKDGGKCTWVWGEEERNRPAVTEEDQIVPVMSNSR